jgi:hypothetical protein
MHSSTDSQRLPCPDYEIGQCRGKQEIGEDTPKCRLETEGKLLVKMEYTTANTSHQNALVEVEFTYLAAKARAAKDTAAVPRDRRLKFFLR